MGLVEIKKEQPGRLQGGAPALPGLSHAPNMLLDMLTLDRTTLFYHDLRLASQSNQPRDDLAEWAAEVPMIRQGATKSIAPPGPPRSRSDRSKSKARSLTAVTTLSNPSVRSTLGGYVGVKAAEGEGETGGISNHEETDGEEHVDSEANKGRTAGKRKGRALSDVSWHILFPLVPSDRMCRLLRAKRCANAPRIKICLRRLFLTMRGVARSYQHCFSGQGPNTIRGFWAIPISVMLFGPSQRRCTVT